MRTFVVRHRSIKIKKEISKHLESGQAVCGRSAKVAYGTTSFEVFAELDRLWEGWPIRVLLHPSWDGQSARPKVGW